MRQAAACQSELPLFDYGRLFEVRLVDVKLSAICDVCKINRASMALIRRICTCCRV